MSGVTSCTTFLFCRILYQIIEIETMKAGDLMIDIDKYKNIIFMSQPRGYLIGGQSILIDGKVISGSHNNAG